MTQNIQADIMFQKRLMKKLKSVMQNYFLRYFENKYLARDNYNPTPRFKMMIAIKEFIHNSDEEAESRGISLDWKTFPVTHLSNGEFFQQNFKILIFQMLQKDVLTNQELLINNI